MKYIKSSQILDFTFQLDDKYNLGTTYEDSLSGKYVRLSSEQVDFLSNHPTASVKEVWDMKLREPMKPSMESIRGRKLSDIRSYDTSPSVNSFTLGTQDMWLDKSTRVGLMNSITIEKETGRTTTTLWFSGVQYTLPIDTAIGMLNALELYALACYNVTAQHLATVSKLTTVEEINAYDYTVGYPDKLVFNL